MENGCGGHLAALVHDSLDVSGGVNHAQISRSSFDAATTRVDRGSLNGDERPDCLLRIYAQGHHFPDPILVVYLPRASRRIEILSNLATCNQHFLLRTREDFFPKNPQE